MKEGAVLVTDTGPLIALAGIGQLGLLRELYSAVVVPQAVHGEVLAGGSFATGLANYQQADWLDVIDAGEPDLSLLALLDEGEAAVIALARARKITLVLIDEQKARKVARDIYGLTVIGSVHVLIEAKQRGLLERVGGAIQGMRDNGYRLHDTIVRYALEAAGETDSPQ